MFVGTLPPVSNRASLTYLAEAVDDETGEPIDLSGLTIALEVRDPDCCSVVLSATTANEKITIVDTGVFEAHFTRDEMATLHRRTYEIGATIADDTDTAQFIIGTLPVLHGIVTK